MPRPVDLALREGDYDNVLSASVQEDVKQDIVGPLNGEQQVPLAKVPSFSLWSRQSYSFLTRKSSSGTSSSGAPTPALTLSRAPSGYASETATPVDDSRDYFSTFKLSRKLSYALKQGEIPRTRSSVSTKSVPEEPASSSDDASSLELPSTGATPSTYEATDGSSIGVARSVDNISVDQASIRLARSVDFSVGVARSVGIAVDDAASEQGANVAVSPVPRIPEAALRSTSTPNLHQPTARPVLPQRQSLPTITDETADVSFLAQLQSPELNLALRQPLAAFQPPRPRVQDIDDDIDIEMADGQHQRVVATADDEGVTPSDSASQDSKTSIWSRTKQMYIDTYCPTETPPLLLPTGPTDVEKLSYLKTNRIPLYAFGVFSFLSLSAGMWLFTVSTVYFYWFGAVVFLLQLYLIISYTVSICGKDYDYKKHQKMVEDNPINELTAPTVDIYLPCCKEPIEVLENTYKYVTELKWPAGKMKVFVLDDGAQDEVRDMAAKYNFEYIVRGDRPRLKKAGNLRWAFARTSGDFFAIFDADFCPRPDFLNEIMPIHMSKTDTAIVQTPQFFRTSDKQTWVEQGAGSVQELFYRVVQINRNRWGASICVGSNAVYRREALAEVGGTAEIGFSEDVHTGFYALTRGWKVRYLPLCLACGICPDTPKAFFSQQMRWCMGSTTLLTNMDFWRSSLSPVQKICYLSGMMYYSAVSLSIFLSPMPGLMMIWARPDYVHYYNLAFAFPSILYSLIALRLWAKSSYGLNVQHIMYIQSFAYLTAIKDRLFGRALAWVPSGDTKSHKNNKYRNMRILACCWMGTIFATLISGITYQILRGGLIWYDTIPLICLDTFNLYIAHRFLFWHGKI